ncbi:MAG: glycoside hydrolase [Actinobacteria bacterium]|nr:glycoside hydrolase [Actinomycetota bacterium]
MRRLLITLSLLALIAAACTSDDGTTTTGEASTTTAAPATTTTATTTTTTAPEGPLDPEGFYLMLMWHQHQPLYPKDADGVVTRPWVRVHATKDYYDMAAMLREFPNVKATFNLTPVLLLQLEELAAGTKDVYWVLSEIPAAELTEEQQRFILERFFDANARVIARFPRYQELRALRDDGTPYTEQDFRDLQVLFNLAWTDPSFLAEAPLSSLVAKGRDFAEEDKAVLFAEHLRIIEAVIPVHARLWQEGRIEVTTTPLAHPILPLIADSAIASTGDPAAILPRNRFNEVADAQEHVRRGLDLAERLLGARPAGMWPGEGAVSQYVIPMFSAEGVRWIATGEDVLAPSLGLGSFTRDASDTVQEADLLYRPWLGVPRRNDPVPIFFRDRLISDLVGFQYSGTEAEAAAADFMNRLRAAKERLAAQGATGPHVVSVILDGENAWENYPNDGIDFLRALYGALNEADWVRTVTPSEYLAAFGDRVEALDEVWPGAWFSSNYATWIGEPEEATAWDYLWEARDDLRRAERSGAVSGEALEAAFEKMLFAQGSDWFWWYGDDQSSGNDDYFDAAFRELLGQMYDALGQERPTFVSVPIIPQTPILPSRPAGEGVLSPTLDGVAAEGEWDAAAAYLYEGSGAALYLGVSPTGFHLRLDIGDAAASDGFDVYLGVPGADRPRPTTLGGQVLGFGASHLLRWEQAAPRQVLPAVGLPGLDDDRVQFGDPLPIGISTRTIEITLPMEQLGAVEAGDLIPLRIVAWDREQGELVMVPADAPGAAQVPDISNVEVFLEVADPTGDDHGPGSYTYPRDGVFAAGSYDLTSVTFGTEGGDLVVTLQVLATIANPWGSPNGLAIQTLDIYIDRDPGSGTGARRLIDGRNAALEEGNGWEYGITVEGWYPAIYVAAPDGTTQETTPTFRVIVLGDKGRVIVRVPLELLGGGDPAAWGYAVALMSQEGYPSSGVRRVRDVMVTAEQWRIGGAPGPGVTHTRIMDLLWPEAGKQEEWLSAYTPAASVEELTPDQFAQMPLLTAE